MGFFFGGHSTTTCSDMIGDFQINSASYGEIVPEILGTTRVSGNVIYWDDFTAHEHSYTQRTGKGGGSKHTSITYTYTVAAAIGLCEGPIEGVGKVWRNKEIYTYPHDNIELTLFDGSYGQSPWPYVIGKHPDKALPYSGLAYMAGVVDLGDSGALPNFNFEVRGKLLNSGDGIDVNPADYIVHILKSIGIDDANIVGLNNYRTYCREADILISTPPDSNGKKAQTIINEIADITNSYLFWSNDSLKIVPLADTAIGQWDPNLEVQYDLTVDDFIPNSNGELIVFKRKDTAETYNQATVEFINRANGYEKETVTFDVLADIQKHGVKPARCKPAHYLFTKSRAQYYAEQLAMKYLYGKTQYTFKLDWAFCRLEPGDLVTLTDESCQLVKQVVIITSVTESSDGELVLTAIGRPPGAYTPAKYVVHENERPFIDYNKPADNTIPVIIQAPSDLTATGMEVWVGGSGSSNNWSGADVYVSDNNTAYKRIGTLTNTARFGTLLTACTDNERELVVKITGNLSSGTVIDAERGNTVCWLGGECFSYEKAMLIDKNTYKLIGCIRGQYNTVASGHDVGTTVLRLDEALLKVPYKKEDIGKKIWVKFASINMFGAATQDLADVKSYEFDIKPYYIPDVSNYTLFTKYYDLGKGVSTFDVIAKFNVPSLEHLDTVECWYREKGTEEWQFGGDGNGQIAISGCEIGHMYEVKLLVRDKFRNYSQGVVKTIAVEMKAEVPNAPDNVSISIKSVIKVSWAEVQNATVDYYEVRTNPYTDITDGLLGRTSGTSFEPELVERKGSIYVIAHNPFKGYGTAAKVEYNVPKPKPPKRVYTRTTLDGFSVSFDAVPDTCKSALVYIDGEAYKTISNSLYFTRDVGIYKVEVAYVDLFGEGSKSLYTQAQVTKTIDPSVLKNVKITEDNLSNSLQQTLSNLKDYDPTTTVNKLLAPIKKDLNGLETTVANNKQDVQSQILQNTNAITRLVTSTSDNKNTITKIQESVNGVKTTVADVAKKQDGIDTKIVDVEHSINGVQSTVSNMQTSVNSATNTVNTLSSKVTQTEKSITSVVSQLNGDPSKSEFTAITQLNNALGLKVGKGDLISSINASPDSIKIKSSLIKIDGTTQIGNNVITKNMIQTGAITADKLNVSTLSAISADFGTFDTETKNGKVKFSGSLIEVYDKKGNIIVRIGDWSDEQ